MNNSIESNRIQLVKTIFSQITQHYDLLNHLLSMGRDIYWRRKMVKELHAAGGSIILDVAAGTGDLAFEIIRKYNNTKILGIDFVMQMLDRAKVKSKKIQREANISFIAGDALHLPFPDDKFDAAVTAFSFRNIPDRLGALWEMQRAVKPGGTVAVLEMTFQRNIRMQKFWFWYLNNVIPVLGGFILFCIQMATNEIATSPPFIPPR